MTFPVDLMHDSDSVWMNRQAYNDAEEYYQLFLNQNLTVQVTKCHAKVDDADDAATTAVVMQSSPLINEIAKARDSIKQSLSGMAPTAAPDAAHVTKLEDENKAMKKLIDDLSKQVAALELRVGKLEGGSTPAPASAPAPAAKKVVDDDDDDDFDLDDSEEDEEETEAAKLKKEELLRKYHEKKGNKPVLIAKSSILLDVKPWDDETDMAEIERKVRTVQVDGLVWGQSKFVPVGYGIKKLQIGCVVEDEKVGSDILEEEIMKFDDLVQSVDVAAFNKI